MKRMDYSGERQTQSRLHRSGSRPAVCVQIEMTEERILTHVAEKRARRCGADEPFDPEDFSPKDFL